MERQRSRSGRAGKARRQAGIHQAVQRVCESLEPRRMLAGANDQAILNAITSALLPSTSNGFTTFTNRLKDNNVLGQVLPLVNRGIGQTVTPKTVFDSLLSRLSGTYASVSALGNALEGTGGIGDGVQVLATRDNADNIEYDLRLVGSTTVAVPFSSVFGTLDFAATGNLSLAVSFDFRLTVGAQWGGSNAVFYVADNNDDLKVSASISASNVNATARLGFLDVALSNINATLNPTFAINLVDPGTSGLSPLGRVTLSELNNTAIATLLPTGITAGATTAFSATLATSGAVGLPSVNFNGSWGQITNLSSFTSNLNTLGAYGQLADVGKSVLTGGLTGFATYFGKIAGDAGLGRPMPILGDRWGSALDLYNFVNQRFVTNIGAYGTVETLATRLAAQSGLSNIGFEVSGSTLTYTVNLAVNRTTSIPLDLALADLPLRLEGGAVSVQAQASGTIRFGVDLATREFFIADDESDAELTASATVNASNINASGGVGFVSAQVTGGQAQLNATASINIDKDGANRLTLADMTGGAAGASFHIAVGGSASGNLPISSPLLGLGTQTFQFTWSNLNNPDTFVSNLASFTGFNAFKDLDSFDAAGGINALIDLITTVSNGPNSPMNRKLPIVGKTFAEVVDFVSLLQQLGNNAGIGGTPQNPSTAFNNSDQLLQQIRNVSGIGAANASYALVNGNLEYTVHMDRNIVRTLPVQFGIDESVLDLAVTGNATITLNTDVDIKFGLTPQGTFYVVPSATPVFSAAGTLQLSLNGAARLGFVDVTIAGATAVFGASAAVTLLDPQTSTPASPGRILQSEFAFDNLAAMADFDVVGSVSATLPLTTNLSGLSGGNLVLNWPDVTDVGNINVNTSGVSLLSDFDNVKPADIIDGLNVIPTLLSLLKGSSVFGKSIGLLGGNLGNIADLAARFTTALNNLKSNPNNTATAQKLATNLGNFLTSATGSAVSVAATVAGGDVRFAFTFGESLNGKTIPIGLSAPLGPASFNLGANATLGGSATASLTIGMRLGDGIAAGERFYIAPGAASGAQIAAKVGVSNINANATLGYFSIGVSNGSANVAGTTGGVLDTAKNATLGIQLVDPNGDGRISLAELTGNPSAVLGSVTADIGGNLVLPITSGLPSGQGPSPRVEVVWNNLLSGTPTITTPDLNNLIGADVFNFSSISQGIQSVLSMINTLAGNSIMQTRIPFIDVRLADVFNYVQDATAFWNAISTPQASPAAFAAAIAAADAALPFLTLTPSGDTSKHDPSQSKFYYTLSLDKTFAAVNQAFKFGGGLFTLAGNVQTSLHLTQSMEWGMNPIDGFFVKEGAALNAAATLSATFDKIGGDFGFLSFGVKNGSASVNFGAGVTAVDADPDDVIRLDQLKSNLFGLLNFNLGGTGALSLPLGAHLGDAGPGVKTHFRAYWDAAKPTSFYFSPADRGATPITSLSTDPVDGFAPIQFEIGEWVSQMVGPFFRQIAEYNPLRPELVDFLNTKLPIIGKTPFELMATQLSDEAADAIQMLLDIAQVVNTVTSFVGQGKALDLADYFPTGAKNGGSGAGDDLPTGEGAADGGIGLIGGLADMLRSLRDDYDIQLLALDPDSLGSSITSTAISLFMGKDVDLVRWNPDPFRVSIPINSPEFLIAAIAVGPIVGQITGQIKAAVGFFADPDFGFSTRGLRDHDGDGQANFFDGFFIGDNIENLGQSDQRDPFEVGGFAEVGLVIKGKVTLLGLVGGTIYGGGGITGTIGLDLSDVKYNNANPPQPIDIVKRNQTGGDNRIYFDELEYMVQNHPLCSVLQLGGTLSAYVEFGVSISLLFFDVEVFSTRQDFELFNFDIPCAENPNGDTAVVSGNTLTVHASNSLYAHTIRIDPRYDDQQRLAGFRVARNRNAGTYDREVAQLYNGANINTIDIYGNLISAGTKVRNQQDGRTYELYSPLIGDLSWIDAGPNAAADTFQVSAVTLFEDFTLVNPASPNYMGNVTTVVINGTEGADLVRLNPKLTETIATVGPGGVPGELKIRNILFYGRGGSDAIDLTEIDATTSNLIAATLDGGEGNDSLRGSFAGDYINGSNGNDLIEGNAGNDTLSGGFGDDKLIGGAGHDSLTGGAGDDVLYATSGNDTLDGDAGNDSLIGGIHDDLLRGGTGNDSIAGGSGFDTISGGDGNDVIEGGEDNDVIYGDAGDDTLAGGSQDDFLDGGTGDDSLMGNDGHDVVRQATSGNVVLTNAVITSGTGIDTIGDGVERVLIVATGANERFDVTGWTRGPISIDGAGGTDTIVSSGSDFVVDNASLGRDGLHFAITNIEAVDLTGTNVRVNQFDVGGFTGGGQLTGNGADDLLVLGGAGSATLTASTLTRSIGTSLNVAGIERARFIGGEDNNNFVASAFPGPVTMLGNGGNDTLVGGSGDDSLDGGLGIDSIVGNAGDDLLVGGGGLSTIHGGDGDDVIHGSNDAADVIFGGAGRDYIFGHGGNDSIDAGAGDDTVLGGAGDDTIAGQAGRDLLVGGADHDVLYGHNAAGTGDDNAIDTLYGDHANNLATSDRPDEPGAPGRDGLFGGGGNDLLFGEGGDDFINPGGGSSNYVDYGAGESANPNDFVPPTPTPPPTALSVPVPYDGPTLPNGPITRQRWGELSGSAGTFGVTGGVGISTDVAVVSGSTGTYMAWADNRTGNYEIYVARHTGTGWITLGTSASGTGVSNSPTVESRRPSIALDAAGNPVVAWTELTGGGKKISVSRWTGSAWTSLGTSISGAANADGARIVYRGSTPIVAFINEDGTDQANVLQHNGSSWVAFGSGAVTHASAVDAAEVALATDGTNVAVAYRYGGDIFVRQSNGGAWATLGGAAIVANAGLSSTPTLAYATAGLFVAWRDVSSGKNEIYAARFSGGSWQNVGTSSFSGTGLSATQGNASRPQLAAVGGNVSLAWLDDQVASTKGNFTAVFVRRFNGSSFVEQVAGDAQRRGIHGEYTDPTGLALAMSPTGQAIVAWSDRADGREEIKLRINTAPTLGNAFYVNDAAAVADVYTAAPGSENGIGQAASPAISVQRLFQVATPVSGDVIYLDSGTFESGFTINTPGVRIVGAPGGSTRVVGTITINAANVVLEQIDADNITFTSAATGGGLFSSWVRGALTITNTANVQIAKNRLDGAVVVTGASDITLASNQRNPTAGVAGIAVSNTTGLLIRDNVIRGGSSGILVIGTSGGTIEANDVGGATIGLDLASAFTGQIRGNRFHDGSTGVRYAASADLSSNLIYANGVGIASTVTGQSGSLGSVGASEPNFIFRNTTGLTLANGFARKQHVFGNATGVSGTGTLGGPALADANVIEFNDIGASFGGTVQFNRIGHNNVGLAPTSNTLVHHNQFYRNTTAGISATGATRLQIASNTIYNQTGDAVKLAGNSNSAELRNNILWTDGGYAIHVADDASRTGFFSDYNSLIAGSAASGIVYYSKAFRDLIDWQRDVNRYDLHSVGTTAVDPFRATPRFASLGNNGLALLAPVGGRRESNAAIDAADVLSDVGVDRPLPNLLANPSFESGLSGWTTSQNAAVATANAWSGSGYFSAGNIQVGFAEQTIPISAAGLSNAQIDTADYVAVAGGRFRSASEDPMDRGRLIVRFLNASSAVIGTTTVNPTRTDDRWHLDGARIPIPSGTRSITYRFESTRIAGSTSDAFLDAAFLRVESEDVAYDQGAGGQTVADTSDPAAARLYVRYPDMYQDLELGKPHTIRWESFGNTQERPVRVDLYKNSADGPVFFTTLAASTPDTGEFIFTPGNFGLNFGDAGLRVQVSFVGDVFTLDRSIETSTVPTDGTQYYIDDDSNAGDQYTPGATGNNRNTGKLPSAPKPLLTTLLRVYDLGAGDVVNVDAGTYGHFDNVVISGNLDIGDDEGAVYTGPTAGGTASLFHYFPQTGNLFEFNDGDFTTLRHFTLNGARRGIWARNDSTALTVVGVTVNNTALEGIRLENDAVDAILQQVNVTSAGADGIYSGVRLAEISGGTFSNNTGSGLSLQRGANVLSGNTIQNNTQYGIYVAQSPEASNITSNLIANNARWGLYVANSAVMNASANRVNANGQGGIYLYSGGATSTISGNTVTNHTGANVAGIYSLYGVEIVGNVLDNNTIGVDAGYSGLVQIRNNRITGSTNAGIRVSTSAAGEITGNVLSGNRYGIDGSWSNGSGLIRNNLIYASTLAAIRLTSTNASSATSLVNNTIYQPAGDGVRIESNSRNVALRNNVIWTAAGTGVLVASDSQIGFASDYNLLYATGSGAVGSWQGVLRPTLAAWRNATFGDNNSISADPLFINVDGANNILGDADDDLHLSTPHGYNAGGWLAPVLDGVTGLPVAAPGTLTTNPALPFSPGIDRGDPASAFANEPAPNGSIVNLGAHGNTVQAERSPGTYLLVTSPNGGETWSANQSFTIRWNSHNFTGTVDIQLVRDSNPGAPITIAAGVANSGQYLWTVPTGITPATDYRIRIVRNDAAASDTSDAPFEITGPINIYYVNDDSLAGDVFTTAVGNDINPGTSPHAPKATITAVLAAYDLGPGDIIRVDTGYYGLTSNIVIDAQDAGVTIEGPSGVVDAAAAYASSIAADSPTLNQPLAGAGGAPGAFEGSANQSSYYNGATTAPGSALPTVGNTLSLELWLKPDSTSGTQYLLNRSYTDTRGTPNTNDDFQQRLYSLYRSGNSVTFNTVVRRYNAGTDDYSLTTMGVNGSLFANQWNHVVVTFDGSAANALKIFVNGSLNQQSGAVPANYNQIGPSSHAVDHRAYLGADAFNPAGPTDFYAGHLQALSAYGTALSAARVKEHFQTGHGSQRRAILDRQNTAAGSYVFQFQNADDVTIRELEMTGAYYGAYASSSSDSDRVSFHGVSALLNQQGGIYFENGNDFVTIAGSEFVGLYGGHTSVDDQPYQIWVDAPDALISDNRLRGGLTAITVSRARATVTENNIVGPSTGISANFSASTNFADALIVGRNEISGTTSAGISASYNVRVENNLIVDAAGSQPGISASFLRQDMLGNVVSGYVRGISVTGPNVGVVRGNRVFNNSITGITTSGVDAIGNTVYSNGIGIDANVYGSTAVRLLNNLVYGSATAAIRLANAGHLVQNNTVRETAADGVILYSNAGNATLRNNVFAMAGPGRAINVAADSQAGFASNYNLFHLTGGGKVALWQGVLYDDLDTWDYELGFDAASRIADPLFIDVDGADDILGGVGGEDDNFRFAANSPVIDAGDPVSYHHAEPAPNGDRANIGHLGNTAQATLSTTPMVQVLQPNGREKLSVGTPYDVLFRSAGFTLNRQVMLANLGGPRVGMFEASPPLVANAGNFGANPITLVSAANPAPADVYRTYVYGQNTGVGGVLTIPLDVPNGSYTLRLHFTDNTTANNRRFDIAVNGVVTHADFSIAQAAGGAYRAYSLDLPAVAADDGGITLQLTNKVSFALISGIELFAANVGGVADPRFNLDVSTNGGSSWSPLATNLAVDALGNGSHAWTPTVAGENVLVRVSPVGGGVNDVSDTPFLVAPTGNAYYINDNNTAGDVYTMAIGNNANSGKLPSAPMASIASLLARYDLGPGDIIYVDAGDYTLLSNLIIDAEDAGVEIRGPGGTTILSTNARNAVLQASPLGYWRLGETGGATAGSHAGGGSGTYVGGVTLGQPGAFGNESGAALAASFDGVDDHVVLADPSLDLAGNQLTLAAWVNPTNDSGTKYLISRSAGTGAAQWQYSLFLSNGYVGVQLRNAAGQTLNITPTSHRTVANTWNRVGMIYDGTTVRVFVNDGISSPTNFSGAIAGNAELNTLIGKRFAADTTQLFGGRIQDVVISPTAMSSAAMVDQYFAGVRQRSLAMLHRGNTSSGSYAIELRNADDTKITGLTLTGADYAIYAASNSDSDNLVFDNLVVTGNRSGGIRLEGGNDAPTLQNSTIIGLPTPLVTNENQSWNVYFNNLNNAVVKFNTFGNTTSYAFYGPSLNGALIEGNTILNTANVGITVSGNNWIIRDNDVRGTASTGINGSSSVNGLIEGNSVRQRPTGIDAYNRVTVRGNVVQGGSVGIRAQYDTLIAGNRVSNNTTGIHHSSGGSPIIRDNRIYSNGGGLWINSSSGASNERIENNIFYANTTRAVRFSSATGTRFVNNTIYEPTAHGILVDGASTQDLQLRSNLFVLAAGRAIEVTPDAQRGVTSDYNLFQLEGTAQLARWQNVDITSADEWFYRVGMDGNSLFTDPRFADLDGPDNLLGFVDGVDRGADDAFTFQTTTPTIDAGDPYGYYLLEPDGGGGRVNIGHLGNTPAAPAAPNRSVRLVTPNGREKFETGSTRRVAFETAGLLDRQVVGQFKLGDPMSGSYWLADRFRVNESGFSIQRTTDVVDTSGVVDPPPAAFYQSGVLQSSGTALWHYPVSDGSYSVTLHFNEPSYQNPNQRRFDILLNGTTVRSDLDLFVQAGGRNRAFTLTFDVTAGGGSGIELALVNKLNGSLIQGVEIFRTGLPGAPTQTVSLGVSTNAGATYSPLVNGAALDRFGRGVYDWTITQPLTDDGLVRVSADQAGVSIDTSNDTFQIVSAAATYYVNDASSVGDGFTTAIGNDRNDGKSPARPMATLGALLRAYDLDPGDVVYIDAGTYPLLQNLIVELEDAGVTIRGAGSDKTILHRGNVNADRAVFQFASGASNVTIESLAITGAQSGVRVVDVDSNNNTLDSVRIFANSDHGVLLNSGGTGAATNADGWTISNADIHGVPGGPTDDNQTYGVYIAHGSGHSILGSTIHQHGTYGVYVVNGTVGALIRGNAINNNGNIGIYVSGSSAARARIEDNDIYSNTQYGIQAGSYVDIIGNRIRGHVGSGRAGIQINGSNASVVGNVVYNNYRGIDSTYVERVADNRVYFNAEIGIAHRGGSGVVERNQVYSNAVGISVVSSPDFSGRIQDNLVYVNADRGIEVLYSHPSANLAPKVYNNTVYQLVGDAVYITNAPNVRLRNNILYVGNGYAIRVLNAAAQNGFNSDRNIIHKSDDPNASVGFWGGVARSTLADWQAASGQDGSTLAADPKFVDIDGADNVLGYSTAGNGYDGGPDDNFYLLKTSPAIDRGDSAIAPKYDYEGKTRADDPATTNAGTPDFFEQIQPTSGFAAIGTARNWRSTGSWWQLTLPFTFNFYGTDYTQAYVTSEGYIQLGTNTGLDFPNEPTLDQLGNGPRIAVLWDNLSTAGTGNDIFTHTAEPNQITIRWAATRQATGTPVNASMTLFSDGTIRFDYGAGNEGLTPVVGVASGVGAIVESQRTGASTLTNAVSSLFNVGPGIRDIGAFEFRGASNDVTPPRITSTLPAAVHANGASPAVDEIGLIFSEPINRIDAQAAAAYRLVGAGADNLFGTIDDVAYALTPVYVDGSTQATLKVNAGELPVGMYRLTVFGNSFTSTGLHDLSGLLFDGDANGTEGGDYVRTFTILADTEPPTVDGVTFHYVNPQHAMTVVFSEDVGPSLSLTDFALLNLTTGTTVAAAMMALDYDAVTRTATITFPGLPGERLAAGQYRLTVIGGGVTDAAGNAMAADHVKTFTFVPGDVNGDGVIGFDDLLALAQHYGGPGTYQQGDFNYDGVVNFDDLLLLAQVYGTTIGGDTTPPSVSASAFDYVNPQHAMVVTFSENVGASLSPADFEIRNVATNQVLPTASLAVSFDPATNRARVTFPGLPDQRLQRGTWRLTVIGAGILDAALNVMAGNYQAQYVFIPGDFNGDGVVGFDDLLKVAQNYGRPGDYTQGDANYDGQVGFDDLLAISQAYGLSSIHAAMSPATILARIDDLTRKERPTLGGGGKRRDGSVIIDVLA